MLNKKEHETTWLDGSYCGCSVFYFDGNLPAAWCCDLLIRGILVRGVLMLEHVRANFAKKSTSVFLLAGGSQFSTFGSIGGRCL